MAEGADGEEEIQFLRTVSDTVCIFSNSLQLRKVFKSTKCHFPGSLFTLELITDKHVRLVSSLRVQIDKNSCLVLLALLSIYISIEI